MIVAIGGVSTAGKTYLARNIHSAMYHKRSSIIIHQDDFVYPMTKIPMLNNRTDWESPASIDFNRFSESIDYCAEKFDVVIVEGLMVYYLEEVVKKFDKGIFLDLAYEEFIKRKESDFRWGKEEQWYIEHIWASHLKHGLFKGSKENILKLDASQEQDLARILRSLEIDL